MDTTPKDRMLKAQTLYEQMQRDNAALDAFEKSLEDTAAHAKEMLDYYEALWLEDMQELYDAGEQIEVMGEDQIYNAIQYQYAAMKRILLVCATYINR